jgi:alkaline phosphatase D
MFNEHNFGMIYFSGSKAERQMKLVLNSLEGKELWSKVILRKDLDNKN